MTDLLVRPDLETAMDTVADRSLAIEDRAAVYGVLHQIQLRINRKLRAAKDDLIDHLRGHDLRELGPLSLKSTPVDVEYVCNDEGNWGDIGVQDAMAMLVKIAPEYIRHVPDHYEINAAALGQGMAMGDPVARELYAEIKRKGWRTEGGRRWSLTVAEVKPPKADAA